MAAASLAFVLPSGMALLIAGLVGGTVAFLMGRRRAAG